MPNLTRVSALNQVQPGDTLVQIEQENEILTYKVHTSNWIPLLAGLVETYMIDIPKTTIRLMSYESPLRYKLLKKITIEK